ncbi:FecCD family ABC transporter permease [Kroppenstedtia eburnea]
MEKSKSLRDRRSWKMSVLVLFSTSALVTMLYSVSAGAVTLSLKEVWSYLFFHSQVGGMGDIIWNIRLPRTLVAALVGANLAVSGALLQGVMRNPLADPHIIGVSSGAGLLGMTVLILFPHLPHLLIPVAFIGASGAALIVYVLAWKNGVVPTRIILAGVAVSAFFGAGISTLLTFYSDRLTGTIDFLAGSLSARSWPHLETILPYTILGLLIAGLGSQKMNILMLGDTTAKSLGTRVEVIRLVMTATATLLAASAVSVAGLLGFVGLIVPHAARLLVGNDYRVLIPASAMLGVVVITFCDTLARLMFAPIEIPVGVMMGAVGAPFFLYLLRRRAM